MKRMIFGVIVACATSFAAELPPLPTDMGPFTGLEMTVGYIQKENGEKFLVVETPEGTKVVKVKADPLQNSKKTKIK